MFSLDGVMKAGTDMMGVASTSFQRAMKVQEVTSTKDENQPGVHLSLIDVLGERAGAMPGDKSRFSQHARVALVFVCVCVCRAFLHQPFPTPLVACGTSG